MTAEIEQHRREIEALCHEYDVERLALFGSAATDGFHPNSSDLDFLVEFRTPLAGHANRYFGLLEGLQNLFKRPVDVVVESAVRNPYFREAVDRDKARRSTQNQAADDGLAACRSVTIARWRFTP